MQIIDLSKPIQFNSGDPAFMQVRIRHKPHHKARWLVLIRFKHDSRIPLQKVAGAGRLSIIGRAWTIARAVLPGADLTGSGGRGSLQESAGDRRAGWPGYPSQDP